MTKADANTKETSPLIWSSGVCSSKQVRSLESFLIIDFFLLPHSDGVKIGWGTDFLSHLGLVCLCMCVRWERPGGRRVLRWCYWVPWLKKKNVGLEMVSSGGCLWNQNTSLACSSETHYCDLKKKPLSILRGKGYTQLLESQLGRGKCRWMKWTQWNLISNTSIDLNIDWGCVDYCVWAPSPAWSPGAEHWSQGVAVKLGWKREDKGGQSHDEGRTPTCSFSETEILQIKISPLVTPIPTHHGTLWILFSREGSVLWWMLRLNLYLQHHQARGMWIND